MVSTVGYREKPSHQVLLPSHLLNSRNSYHSEVYLRFYFYFPTKQSFDGWLLHCNQDNFYINNYECAFIRSLLIATSDCFDVSIIFESINSTASTFSIGLSMSGKCSFNVTKAYKFIYFVHLKVH